MCLSSTGQRWARFPSASSSTAVSDSNFRLVLVPTEAFLTDGVSESEFKVIIDEELHFIRSISSFRHLSPLCS